MPMPIIVKLTTFSLHVQVLVGSASKKPKVATKVSSVFSNESDEDSWSLPEGGSAYTRKTAWKAHENSRCHVCIAFCRVTGLAPPLRILASSQQPHMNKLGLENSTTNFMNFWGHIVQGNLFVAGFWKLFIAIALGSRQCPSIWDTPL